MSSHPVVESSGTPSRRKEEQAVCGLKQGEANSQALRMISSGLVRLTKGWSKMSVSAHTLDTWTMTRKRRTGVRCLKMVKIH